MYLWATTRSYRTSRYYSQLNHSYAIEVALLHTDIHNRCLLPSPFSGFSQIYICTDTRPKHVIAIASPNENLLECAPRTPILTQREKCGALISAIKANSCVSLLTDAFHERNEFSPLAMISMRQSHTQHACQLNWAIFANSIVLFPLHRRHKLTMKTFPIEFHRI